jgi:hypothetical protein
VSSDNPIGADNQQETNLAALDPGWVLGFTDGEGCFSVSIHQNALAVKTGGWQIQPTFQVSQHSDHQDVLEALHVFFRCGKVRSKGAGSAVKVFVVHSTIQLLERVVPFFEQHELRVKRDDFEKFADIVVSVRSRAHHDLEEFDRIVRLAYSMNARGKQRKRPIEEILLGSSETVREVPLNGSAVKIQSGPHGDMGSQTEMI